MSARMLGGDYTREEVEGLDYEDFDEDDDTKRPTWQSKRRNLGVQGYATLHVADLNAIRDGETRRMFAVYGVPVGWGKQDAEVSELRERVEAIEALRDEGDDDAVAATYSRWGFVDEAHYEWIRERLFPGWEARGEMQDRLDAQRAELKEQHGRRVAEMSAELAPVLGVSLEDWAGGNARLAQGGELSEVLGVLGIDAATWQQASDTWNARMSADTTATIATVYGQAFTGAGVGRFAGAGAASAASMTDPGARDVSGEEPISFERWIEITEAQNAGVARGEQAADILARFGMTPADWGVVGGWWSQRFAAEAMSRIDEYNALSERYRSRYSAGGTDPV